MGVSLGRAGSRARDERSTRPPGRRVPKAGRTAVARCGALRVAEVISRPAVRVPVMLWPEGDDQPEARVARFVCGGRVRCGHRVKILSRGRPDQVEQDDTTDYR
ncbi:hypothetical protein GCM10023335_43790 [Streptomyces siamensis]|uniref:DUF1918 domain-containing protein n=1 Tax=Streptomyces siamensis TaxID=1274986 RepID=A0ABP9J1E5_9ACTN